MPVKTFANIRDALSIVTGDYLHSTVTTALAASTSIVDTTIANVKGGGTNDYFNNWYALITALANSGANRIISDFVASTYTFTAQGGNFTSDSSAKATYELHRYDPALKTRAINLAARNIGNVYRSILDYTLISGNILPNAHAEDWNSTSYPDFYSVSNATAAKTATAGLHRGGTNSALVTATTAAGYMFITSNDYPRLLDLKNKTVDFYVWAYPHKANDATMVVYTLQADGTAQTLATTTLCPASKWTKLGLTDQTLNDDLIRVEIRFPIATISEYAQFDDWRLETDVYDYLLPQSLQDGTLNRVGIQIGSGADDSDDQPCDDIGSDMDYQELYGWRVVTDGQYKYLRTDTPLPHSRRIQLQGIAPLEHDATADTDTFTINDPQMDLLVAMSAKELFGILKGQVTSDTKTEYEREYAYWAMRVNELKGQVGLMKPSSRMRFS